MFLSDEATPEGILVDLSVNSSGHVIKEPKEFLLSRWNVSDVCKFISDLGFPQYVSVFEKNAIDGTELANITEDALISALGISEFIVEIIRE